MGNRFASITLLNGNLKFTLPGAIVAFILGILFSLAFIVTPYWSLPSSLIKSLVILLLTIVTGTAWSLISASRINLSIDRKDLLLFILLTFGLLVLNWRQLIGGIPASGDEAYHISKTLGLVSSSYSYLSILALIAAPIVLYILYKQMRWGIFLLGLLLLGIIMAIQFGEPFGVINPERLLRYPFFNYWFTAILPNIAARIKHPYYEILYRIIPFFSAVSIAWLFQRELATHKIMPRLVWGLGIGLLPIVIHHSSILYLDIPAAFLMLYPCFRIKQLVSDDYAQLKQDSAWYALILIGFIKETTLPFLACFLALRWLIQFNKFAFGDSIKAVGKETKTLRVAIKVFWQELGIGFSILFPLFFYLFFRSYYSISRGYDLNLANLFGIQAYSTLFRSLMEQFGLFLLLFIFGCAFLLARREYIRASFLLLVVIAYPLFYLVDSASYSYVGYSRFNLFLVPPILAMSSPLLAWFVEHKPKFSTLILGSLIITNLMISPINSDGTKTLQWKFSEHHYPYPQAIRWLKENYPDNKILFAGLRASYYFDFYFAKYGWTPNYEILQFRQNQNDSDALTNVIPTPGSCDQCIIVFHLRGNEIPDVKETANLEQMMVFRNQAHTLVIYRVESP